MSTVERSICWSSSVPITAGATALTTIPWVATSLASALVSPMTPALAVEYGTSVGLPSLPAMEAMLTMRPLCRGRMSLTAARQTRKTLVRSTAITCCQSASVSSHVGNERPVMPALLTTTSRRPCQSCAACTAPSTSAVRVTSATMARALPPRRLAAPSTAGASRSSITTRAPSASSRSLIARPMPRPAPVTSAVRPSSRLMLGLTRGPG